MKSYIVISTVTGKPTNNLVQAKDLQQALEKLEKSWNKKTHLKGRVQINHPYIYIGDTEFRLQEQTDIVK